MPPKSARTVYACDSCGAVSPKWAGQCAECGAWNSLQETVAAPPAAGPARSGRLAGYAGAAETRVQNLAEVGTDEAARLATGIHELDRVLGGGLTVGSVVLIGGDPGIGKSTLLLQTLAHLAAQHRALYVTGEESPQQVSQRAQRLRHRDRPQRMDGVLVARIPPQGRSQRALRRGVGGWGGWRAHEDPARQGMRPGAGLG